MLAVAGKNFVLGLAAELQQLCVAVIVIVILAQEGLRERLVRRDRNRDGLLGKRRGNGNGGENMADEGVGIVRDVVKGAFEERLAVVPLDNNAALTVASLCNRGGVFVDHDAVCPHVGAENADVGKVPVKCPDQCAAGSSS